MQCALIGPVLGAEHNVGHEQSAVLEGFTIQRTVLLLFSGFFIVRSGLLPVVVVFSGVKMNSSGSLLTKYKAAE